jgi:hypothetical protein
MATVTLFTNGDVTFDDPQWGHGTISSTADDVRAAKTVAAEEAAWNRWRLDRDEEFTAC